MCLCIITIDRDISEYSRSAMLNFECVVYHISYIFGINDKCV
jgi:hypothetical protein